MKNKYNNSLITKTNNKGGVVRLIHHDSNGRHARRMVKAQR